MGKLFAVRQVGDGRIYTKDAASKDMLITPSTRITAEPAPPVVPGEFGVRLTGQAGPAPKQVDIDLVWAGIENGLGMLSAGDVAKIKAKMLKFAGSTGGPTNSVGITATANDAIRQSVSGIEAINKANADFWDKRIAETDARTFGR